VDNNSQGAFSKYQKTHISFNMSEISDLEKDPSREKNFLSQMFFNKLSSLLNGDGFNWFYNSTSLNPNIYPYKKNSNFMFTHMLFMEGEGKMSKWSDMFEPIIYSIDERFKVNKLLRMKLNLYTNQNKKIHQPSHCDITDTSDNKGNPLKGVNTSILNFTTCNGGTKIGNKTYDSEANELITFSNTIKHNGIVQTNTSTRVVLNINWE
jgi:hypothetical protein